MDGAFLNQKRQGGLSPTSLGNIRYQSSWNSATIQAAAAGGAIHMNGKIPGLFAFVLLALVCIALLMSPSIVALIPH